jgi:membrane-bound lytic murein transglycosylase F
MKRRPADRLFSLLRALRWALGLLAVLAMTTSSRPAPLMEQIRSTGQLRVAMVNDPTSYYLGPAGYMGFDYDLARLFAESLGVELMIVQAMSRVEALRMVEAGTVHLAATNLLVTPQRAQRVRFTRPLRYVVPQLVGRGTQRVPDDLSQLDETIIVAQGSSQQELLEGLVQHYPELPWDIRWDTESEALLQQVADREIALTVASSDLVAITRRYYPQLRVLKNLDEPRPVAWAVSRDTRNGLLTAAVDFLQTLGGVEMARLRDRYFGHVDRLTHADAIALATHFDTRLPQYRELFEAAGAAHEIDWRLLAAVGYQESLWNNRAVSPTGVRGLMQITNQTARFLGIADRMDPDQTIDGAARYLKSLHSRLPTTVPEPDRTWMMLASYNIGLGHVLDARRLTEEQGGDPNRWVDLRQRLPLLTQPRIYRNLRYGYARGPEAVQYVGNVRTFYDMMVWLTGGNQIPDAPVESNEQEMRPEAGRDPLKIDNPAL